MKKDNLSEVKISLSLRNIFDIGVIAGIAFLYVQQQHINNEINSLVTLMEATSAEATLKIQKMTDAELSIAGTEVEPLDGKRNTYRNLEVGVSTVGAMRVTEKLKEAFGGNQQIIVTPMKEANRYSANIGGKEFEVAASGNYVFINDIAVPIQPDEYREFRKSEKYKMLVKPDTNTNVMSVEDNNNKDTKNHDKLDAIYGAYGKVPGLTISHDDYFNRLKEFEKVKAHSIKFEGINSKKELFVFFDISCPSCQKFFKSIPLYQESGYNINLLLIDKTRKYNSEKAKSMATLYCETDKKRALIELMTEGKAPEASCEHGEKFLESMTNAALLVGTVGTPSIFTDDAIPIYSYNENSGKYNPMYNLDSVENWLSTNGYL